jgi:Lrp/AsnC family leucine-responsive transcriptional regulator
MEEIDQIDRKILGILQEDGKITITALAEQLKITATPVHERIKKMEELGIISKYVALLEQKRLIKTSLFLFQFP